MTIFEKLKDSMKVNIYQITLAGILIGIGVIADTFFRVGRYTFITTSIYIVIGLLLPIWLGVSAALAIDTLQLIFRGMLGYWYWSLQLEPAIIVFISFTLRFLFTSIKSKKVMQIISILFMVAIIIGGSLMIGLESEKLSVSRNYIHGRHPHFESDSEFTTRLIRSYISILGLIFVIAIMSNEIYKITKGKTTNRRIASLIVVVITALLFDWLYHPWAVYNWQVNSLGLAPSLEIFKINVITGIWGSTFHIGMGIPLVAAMYYVAEHTNLNKKQNKY